MSCGPLDGSFLTKVMLQVKGFRKNTTTRVRSTDGGVVICLVRDGVGVVLESTSILRLK